MAAVKRTGSPENEAAAKRPRASPEKEVIKTAIKGYLDFCPHVPGIRSPTLLHEVRSWVFVESSDAITAGTPALVRKPPVTIYGKQCFQQRSVGYFALPGVPPYPYNPAMVLPCQEMPPAIKEAMETLNRVLDTQLNSCLANFYADGSEYISAHQDNEKTIAPNSPVVAVSLGETRTFRIRDSKTNKIVLDLPLPSGSVVIMRNQVDYKHEIPKQLKKRGSRWSLTFRQIQKV